MSKLALLEKLTNKEYRDAFISDEIDVGLPMQLRSMREEREWKQSYVAEKTGTKQPRITLMEKPGYGNFSLNTLKELASLFDVGLIVSFVPWSEMIDFTEALSNKRLAVPDFSAEYMALEKRYSRGKVDTSTLQGTFDYSNGTSTAETYQVAATEASVSETEGTMTKLIESAHLATVLTEKGGSTYAKIG